MLVILLCMSVITGLGLRLQLLCHRGHYPIDVEALVGPSKLICASMDRIYGGVVNAPDGNGNGVSRCSKSGLFSSTFASKEARRRVAVASAAHAVLFTFMLFTSGSALHAQVA